MMDLKKLLQEATEEFEAHAVEAEDLGEFPGFTKTVATTAVGKIECFCTTDFTSLYGCDYSIVYEGKTLYSKNNGKISGKQNIDFINECLSTASAVNTYVN